MDRTVTDWSATKDLQLAATLERQAEEQVEAGALEAAADLYDRVLRLRIDGRSPDVFATAEALARTSNEACCQLTGNRERLLQAERRLQRTLTMLDEILDAQSGVGPSAAPLVSGVHLTLSNLAALHLRAARQEMALKLLKEAEVLGPSIPASEAAATQLSLCALLSGMRRHIEAERHASEAITLGEADIFQLQSSRDMSPALLQEKASTLAVAYNNLAVQREYLGCSDCLALYEKAVVLAEGYMSKDSPLLAQLRDSHRTALQLAVERKASAASNRQPSGPTIRRPASAIEARGQVKRAESAEASSRRPASAARARDGRWDAEVASQPRRDSSSSRRPSQLSKDRSLLSRELAKLLRPEAQEQSPDMASWFAPKDRSRLPKIQWHESSATSASSSVEDTSNSLPPPALPSHMRFALHQVEAARPEGKTPEAQRSPEKDEPVPPSEGTALDASSRQSSKTRRDSGASFDGRLGAGLQRALDFGRCEAARRIQRAYRDHRRLQMILARAEQVRSSSKRRDAETAAAGPPQGSSPPTAANLPRPANPGRMPRARGAADKDLTGLPRCSLPNLGAGTAGPDFGMREAPSRSPPEAWRRHAEAEASRKRRARAARTIQANWTQHRLRLRQWAVLVVQRWARSHMQRQLYQRQLAAVRKLQRFFRRCKAQPPSQSAADVMPSEAQVCDQAASDEAPLAEAASAEGQDDEPRAQPAAQDQQVPSSETPEAELATAHGEALPSEARSMPPEVEALDGPAEISKEPEVQQEAAAASVAEVPKDPEVPQEAEEAAAEPPSPANAPAAEAAAACVAEVPKDPEVPQEAEEAAAELPSPANALAAEASAAPAEISNEPEVQQEAAPASSAEVPKDLEVPQEAEEAAAEPPSPANGPAAEALAAPAEISNEPEVQQEAAPASVAEVPKDPAVPQEAEEAAAEPPSPANGPAAEALADPAEISNEPEVQQEAAAASVAEVPKDLEVPQETVAHAEPVPIATEAQQPCLQELADCDDEKEPLAEPSAAEEMLQGLKASEEQGKEADRISVDTDDASTEDELGEAFLPQCEAWICSQCGLVNEVCPDLCVLCEAGRSPARRRASLAQLASSGAARSMKVPPTLRRGARR